MLARLQSHHELRFFPGCGDLEFPSVRAEENHGPSQIQRLRGGVRIEHGDAALLKHLQFAREESQPRGGFVPTGPHEQSSEEAVVYHRRRLEIAEAGLVGSRPQEFIPRAESAAQQEVVVHEPALQDLAAGPVAIVCRLLLDKKYK